ncbi:MAG: HPF/RaiA family ribosome-associated protein [Planctomycetota bacterium]
MEILVHRHQATVTPELRELAIRRLHFALDRHASHIDRVQIWLSDEGSHSGSHDRCRIVIHAKPTGTVVVEETRSSLEAAISVAAEHAERALRRSVEKRRSRRVRAA